jgi:hypothetical protein
MAASGSTTTAARPSAAERARVARRLRGAAAEERLSLDTFEARLGLAFSARTSAELDGLLADLPPTDAVGRALLRATSWLSLWTARLAAAWRQPRVPRLVLPAADRVLVGRSRACDCVLTEATVSARHAAFERHGAGWLLRDLGSLNGTFVNGCRVVGEIDVRPGDEVWFGGARFTLAR